LELWREAFSQVSPVTKYFDGLLNYDGQRLPWNIHRAWAQVQEHSSQLFLHIASFICQGVMVRDKPLSLHAQAVSCFNKGKLAKGLQFGRAFQLGRIEGNFLLAGWCSSIRMEDKTSLRPMIVEHQHLFGKGILKSLGTDKGYYSEVNRGYLRGLEGLEEFCLPQPGLDLEDQSPNATAIQARLLDRRSGIEPLIGHAKQGGQLGKSRMKKDESTLAASYASIGGFNLRQLIRHLLGKDIKAMA
jgi:IS5 family transposase